MSDLNADTSGPRGGEWVVKLVAFLFGAGVGALIGTLIVYQFAAAFFGQVPHLRLYCGLGVALLSGLSAYSKAARQVRRQRRSGEVAEQLGLEYSADDDDELEEAIREVFSDSDFLSISNVMRKPMGSAEVAIAELRRRHQSSGSSSSSSSTTRTMAFFDSPELNWPAFTLQPEGIALNMLSKLTGIEDIDFDDYPEFSKAYHLTGSRPDLVRQVFTPELLQYFTDRPGLEIRADGGRLVLIRPGRPCEPEEVEEFLQMATEAFTSLVRASVQTQAVRDGSPQPIPEGLDRQQLPSLVERMVRRAMVTPDELHQFLSEPPPRSIPRKIRARRYSGGSLVAAFVGISFFTVGSCFAAYSILYAEGPWDDNRIVPAVFGTVFPLVGGLIAFFTLRYRYINWRLLKHGIVVDASVLAVEKTSVTVNNQQQYRMQLRYPTRAGTEETYCNIYGRKARESKHLAESGQTTRILYDPNKPSRVLWSESLMLDFEL